MISTDTAIVQVLNDLISVLNDRVEGYEQAAGETADADLKSLFTEMAARSHRFKRELASEVLHMDEEPTEIATMSGRALRTRMDLKAALIEKNRRAILSSCATGEFAALRTYREALESDAQLPVREMIEKQFIMLRHDHDRIRSLRDSATR
jgi:uncharacterized protein (TIGR02284 family)